MQNKIKTKINNGKLSKKTLSILKIAEEFKIKGEHQKAIGMLENLLIEDPECLEAIEEVADNLLSLNEFEKCQKVAEFALFLDNSSYIANHILGFLLLHENKWFEAIKLLRQANETNPNNPEILRCLGWGLYHHNAKDEGIAVLERALNMQLENPMILCDLGICLLQESDIKGAKKLFLKALEVDPGSERTMECVKLIEKFEEIYSQSSSVE